MCGITGYISTVDLSDEIRPALACLNHRGPDAEGIFCDQGENYYVGLGHKRLSIIDLSAGANQPMHSETGSAVLVFNGEIYNFAALKSRLPGIQFKTQSDTEVLLQLYLTHGVKMLDWLEGMFAFALYDRDRQQVLLARDPLGIKPLYYHSTPGAFVFGSEIKSIVGYGIKKELDVDALKQFMLTGFVYEPYTGFKGIKKLPFGSYMIVSALDGKIVTEQQRYWAPSTTKESQPCSQTELSRLLEESVQSHLVSDVPVGLFFSGGVDSSVILTQTKNTITPFTIGYDKAAQSDAGMTDDNYYATKISEHLRVPVKYAESLNGGSAEFLKNVEAVSIKSEELMLDYTFIASEELSRLSKQAGFTVMLSGMGGDECFGGYDRYKLVAYERWYKLLYKVIPFSLLNNVKSFAKKAERLKNYFSLDSFPLKYNSLVGYFSVEEVVSLTGDKNISKSVGERLNVLLQGYEHFSSFKKAILMDISGFLAHNFMVADKSSMLHQIEMRVPLATRTLFDFVWKLDDKEILSFKQSKKLLKKFLEKYLPHELIYRKKTGFNPPLDDKIQALGYDHFMEVIKYNQLDQIFDIHFIDQIAISHYVKKAANNTYKLYQLLYVSYWYKNLLMHEANSQ